MNCLSIGLLSSLFPLDLGLLSTSFILGLSGIRFSSLDIFNSIIGPWIALRLVNGLPTELAVTLAIH